MRDESKFYAELAHVPEMPDYLYRTISRTIVRRRIIIRSVWSICSCLVLALGGAFILPAVQSPVPSAEIQTEIQEMQSYLNGDSLADEINQFAYVGE
jgi:hypothetical protein